MDDSTRQIVFGVACPVVISGALLSVGFLKKPDENGREPWPIRIPLAIGIPTVLAFLALYGWPTGADNWRTTAFAPLLGLAAAVILTYTRATWARPLVAVLLAAAVTFLFRPYTKPEHWVLQVLPAPAMILVLCAMEPLASRRCGPSVVFPLGLAVGAATGLIILSGFLKLTIPLAALSFSMLILFLYSLRRPRFSLASGPMFIIFPTVLIALFVAFLEAKFNARIQKTSVSPMAYTLVALAPLVLWLCEVEWVRARPLWVGAMMRPILVAAVCAAGMVLAVPVKHSTPKTDPNTEIYREMLQK